MSSTTKKHRDFINEPMGSKGVIVIPGIGDQFAAQLQNQGYNQACVIFLYNFYMTTWKLM